MKKLKPIDKYFEAVDYYKEWREKLVRNTAIDYLKKVNPNHPLIKRLDRTLYGKKENKITPLTPISK